jgi:hypothetical protein
MEYYGVEQTVTFSDDAFLGTPISPYILTTAESSVQEIPCQAGWNWISFNVLNADMSPDSLLANLDNVNGDMIRPQVGNQSEYLEGAGWFGDVDEIYTTQMYKLFLGIPGNIEAVGLLEKPLTTPVTIQQEWNWISFVPHVSMSVNDAMSGFDNLTHGDIIKSQAGFAQYINTELYEGWFGSLIFMNPGNGYMLYAANAGILTYPDFENAVATEVDVTNNPDHVRDNGTAVRNLTPPENWNFNPYSFEYSGNITMEVFDNGVSLDSDQYIIGAFAGEECRGTSEPTWVINRWLVFMSIYGSTSSEEMSFKIYSANEDMIFDASETIIFQDNMILGNITDPYEINIYSIPQVPQNVRIEIENGTVYLFWDVSTGANSYKIFASDSITETFYDVTASGQFTEQRLGSRNSIIRWESAVSEEKKFFKIVASSESEVRSVRSFKQK